MQNLFKYKKSDIWKTFAEEVNGKFIKGVGWHSDRTEITHDEFKIIFDNYTIWSVDYSHIMTRVISPIIIKDGFRFQIYRKTFVASLKKIFGSQDICIGWPEFDKNFIVKSNDVTKVSTLFQSREIRDLVLSQKNLNLEISDQKGVFEEKLPDGHFELSFYADGALEDLEQLKNLLLLFKIMIDRLVEIKAIYTT